MFLPILFVVAIFCKIERNVGKPVEVKGGGGGKTQFLGSSSHLFEGDIILRNTNQISARNGVIGTKYRWPRGVVIYELDPTFSSTEAFAIKTLMAEFPKLSCVSFRPRTTETDYVFVRRGGAGTGCNSYVGRQGGKQIVNLEAPGCLYSGSTTHELMHAVGFEHEHSRMDRDSYVKVLWANIDPKWNSAFNKVSGNTFGLPYDYQSITQYPGWAFSANGKNTMEPTPDAKAPFGQYTRLSPGDGKKLNAMYKGYCN